MGHAASSAAAAAETAVASPFFVLKSVLFEAERVHLARFASEQTDSGARVCGLSSTCPLLWPSGEKTKPRGEALSVCEGVHR